VPPSPDTVTNCSDGGVLGPVVGVIGSLQALEVIKIIARGESSFAGNLWLFDGFDGHSRTICLREKMPSCAVCGKEPTVTALQNYKKFCGAGPTDKICSISLIPTDERMTVHEYQTVRQMSPQPPLIDTRPAREFEICHLPEAQNIPLDELKKMDVNTIMKRMGSETDGNHQIAYVICHRGNDSQRAVDHLRSKLSAATHPIRFVDLIGGLEQWSLEIDPSFPRY